MRFYVRKQINQTLLSILLVLLIFNNIIITSTSISNNEQENTMKLTYTFTFSNPSITQTTIHNTTFNRIHLPNCYMMESIGNPQLPVKPVNIGIPYGNTIESITFTSQQHTNTLSKNNQKIETNHPILPVQPHHPIGKQIHNQQLQMNTTRYNTDAFYPKTKGKIQPVQYCRGIQILPLTLYPVQYNPKQKTMNHAQEITITLQLKKEKSTNIHPFYTGSQTDKQYVQTLIFNPEILSTYNQPSKDNLVEYQDGLCNPANDYDYVIITTEKNGLNHWKTSTSLPYNWTSLMNKHTTENNLNCTLVTIEDIIACQDYYQPNQLFNDTPALIREFLKDAYQDWNTTYVLIAGDDEWIPRREMDNGYEKNVDSDLYWSNLDKTFNEDEDDEWGEEGDTGFDAFSELYIGSIPCDTPQDVSNWMKKSFYYTNSTENNYLENAAFYGGNTGWNAEGDDYIEYSAIKGTNDFLGPIPHNHGPYPSWLGFQYGFETWNAVNPAYQYNLSVKWTAESPNPGGWQGGSEQLAINGLKQTINNDQVTLLSGMAHANGYKSLDVHASTWESEYHNTKPFFIHDYGCHCGDMDAADDGVLHSMLFHSDTELAFACVYNTGYGWGNSNSTNSSSAVQQKTFYDYFFDLTNNSQTTNNWQLGKAHAWSKDTLATTINWGYTWREVIQGCLLFGDPAQKLRLPAEIQIKNSQPANNQENIDLAIHNLSVTIIHPANKTFNWTIETIPSIGSITQNMDTNGIKKLSLNTTLQENTTYTWFVNVTEYNTKNWMNETYQFTTRKTYTPQIPQDFQITPINRSSLSLNWTADNHTDTTRIETHYELDESWQRGDHQVLYNDSNWSMIHLNLAPDTTMFYKIWAYNQTDDQWSQPVICNATTLPNQPPLVTNPYPQNTTIIDYLTCNWSVNITDADGDNITWQIQCNNSQQKNHTSLLNETKTLQLTNLSYNTTYTIWVNATDRYDWTNETYTITTKDRKNPSRIKQFTATTMNRTLIRLQWMNAKKNYTIIEYNTNTSWNKGKGNLLINTTNTSMINHSNLNFFTNYYYQAWSYNITHNSYSQPILISNKTKQNHKPIITHVNPSNHSNSNPVNINWEMNINDSDDDFISWNITCSNGQYIEEKNDICGTKTVQLTNLAYNTEYNLTVHLNDCYTEKTYWFVFTTEQKPTSSPPPSSSSSSSVYDPLMNIPPSAHMNSYQTGFVNETIWFTAENSTDEDNDSLTYQWIIKNNSNQIYQSTWLNTTQFSFQFNKPGNYSVNVIVSDGQDSDESETTVIIEEGNHPPQLHNLSIQPICIQYQNWTLHATLHDSDEDMLTCEVVFNEKNNTWIYSNLASNTSFQFLRRWNQTGVFSGKIRVIDEHNSSSTWYKLGNISVISPNQSSSSINSDKICIRLNKKSNITFNASWFNSVQFNETNKVYNWIFDNGKSKQGFMVTHSFHQPGQYTVELQIQSLSGEILGKELIQVILSNPKKSVLNTDIIFYVGLSLLLASVFILWYWKNKQKNNSFSFHQYDFHQDSQGVFYLKQKNKNKKTQTGKNKSDNFSSFS